NGMIPDDVVPAGGARSLVLADVRQIAGGLDAILERGGLSADALNDGTVEASSIRRRLAEVGVALGSEAPVEVFEAAKAYRQSARTGNLMMTVAVLGLALVLGASALMRIRPQMRARNVSESFIKAL